MPLLHIGFVICSRRTSTGYSEAQTCRRVLVRTPLCQDCSRLRVYRSAGWERSHPLRRHQTGCVWCEAAALSLVPASVSSSCRWRLPGEGHGHSWSCGHSWGAVLSRRPSGRRGAQRVWLGCLSRRRQWRGCGSCWMISGDGHSHRRIVRSCRGRHCRRQGCRRQGCLRLTSFPAVARRGVCSGSSCRVHRGPEDVGNAHKHSKTGRCKRGSNRVLGFKL